jgi:hypothetical protein
MDPNENMKEQLELAKRLLADPPDHIYDPETIADIHRLAELVEALDAWLLIGGFLPARWTRNEPKDAATRERLDREGGPR